MKIHVVEKGDSLYQIAQRYKVDLQRLMNDNGLDEETTLMIGQSVGVRVPKTVYIVKQGDTLHSIALEFNISPMEIIRNNSLLIYPYDVNIGDEIVISYKGEKLGETEINGYAYPYIPETLLRVASPFLTNISVFSFSFDENGKLGYVNDGAILRVSGQYGTRPVLVLTNLSEDYDFSSEMAQMLLNNSEQWEHMGSQILAEMRRRGYEELLVDFEYIHPEDKDNYIQFLQEMATIMRENGYAISVALAPKTSDEQMGLLYEAHDYKAIGSIVDGVYLMTYEWGYIYGDPMAVSPVNKVREVLDYAVTQIPSEKIYIGLPNYGYNWMEPFDRTIPAQVVSTREALELAVKYHAEIEFDEKAGAPFFTYYDEEKRKHIVWFQDARSVQRLAELIFEYRLRGAAVWNLMREYVPGWMVLASMYDIKE